MESGVSGRDLLKLSRCDSMNDRFFRPWVLRYIAARAGDEQEAVDMIHVRSCIMHACIMRVCARASSARECFMHACLRDATVPPTVLLLLVQQREWWV